MRSLIITVAGMSSRFNKDTETDVLKCLYYEETPNKALISLQISKAYKMVDEIIIVGGYRYEDLDRFIHQELKDFSSKTKLVYNEHYSDFGSGYSLIKGIDSVSAVTDEIVFIEGDLFFDSLSLKSIIESDKDVISVNNEPILSNKAVVLYFDADNYPHYIYDTSHSCLEIPEPFTSIYNSGQMWKFLDPARVRMIRNSLTQQQEHGTNLEIIQKYFGTYKVDRLDIVRIPIWYNCNTVADYRKALKALNL